jgi:uncharacterized protein (DUF58 family)
VRSDTRGSASEPLRSPDGSRLKFDEAFVRRLEKLRLLARRRRHRGALGTHRSLRRGSGFEPAGHRPYAPGDDWRRIDWNAFRRLEKLYVSEREEEADRTVIIAIDRSGSMASGAKHELALRLAAALAHVALGEGDSVRLAAFAGDTVDVTPPRRGLASIFPILRALDRLEVGGTTAIAGACRRAVRGPVRPGLALLLTDFLDAVPAREAFVALSQGGRDVAVVHTIAPQDERCALEGARRLVDVETGEELVLGFDRRAREDYARIFDRWVRELEAEARRLGATYVRVRSDEPLETVALSVLERAGVLV